MDKTTYKDIDDYINHFSGGVKEKLQTLRKIIKEEAPDAIETISYQMPTFKLNEKNMVHFAAFKNHIGFYPTPSGTENFQKEIVKYKHSKGTIQFTLEEPLPLELVRKIVRFRVQELS